MKEWLRKCQMMAMISLAGFAPALLLGVHAFPDEMWLCGVFAALHFIFACLCVALKGRKRLLTGILLSLMIVLAGFALLPWRERWWSLTMAAGYAALLLLCLPAGGWSSGTELPFNITFIGGVAYVIAQLMQMLPAGDYASIRLPLLMGFFGYAALWMFSLNRQSLVDAASRGQRAPQSMRRKNTALTIGLMIVVLLVSAIPALARALKWAWDRLGELLSALWRLLMSLMPTPQTSGGESAEAGVSAMFGPAEEPSLFSQIMEKVFLVLALTLLAAALVMAARILWRKLRVLLKKLWTMWKLL